MDLLNLFSRLPAAVAQGLIWGIMALGVYITFRVLNLADLTVDGTFALGGAVSVMLILAGWPAWLSVIAAIAAGLAAGLVTGLLHTKLGIPAILAGILTQFSLYSINLRVMGMKSNQTANLKNYGMFFENGKGFLVSSRYIPMAIVMGGVIAVVVVLALYWYFGTEQGSALRATGCNPNMSSAQGINISIMKVLGLSLSNGLVALSGALMTQLQGTADVNMGRGAIVIGLAAIVIGEVFCGAIFKKGSNFAVRLGFMVVGAIVYYFVITIILWLKIGSIKIDANDLKLFTAIIVALFLAVPYLQEKARSPFTRRGRKEG